MEWKSVLTRFIVNDKVDRFRFFTIAYVLLIYKYLKWTYNWGGGMGAPGIDWYIIQNQIVLCKIKLCYSKSDSVIQNQIVLFTWADFLGRWLRGLNPPKFFLTPLQKCLTLLGCRFTPLAHFGLPLHAPPQSIKNSIFQMTCTPPKIFPPLQWTK